jgi:hypothetical protein
LEEDTMTGNDEVVFNLLVSAIQFAGQARKSESGAQRQPVVVSPEDSRHLARVILDALSDQGFRVVRTEAETHAPTRDQDR